MSASELRCPKCGGEMAQGFVIHSARPGVPFLEQWASGPPMTSFWWGVIKLPDSPLIPVGTFRCAGCGYLESYARDQFAAQTDRS